MTLKIIKGNLFDRTLGENEYYVHCISRDYACGAGIVKEFNRRYNLTPRLSAMPRTKAMLVDDVFNLVTKPKYWMKPTYESLKECLLELSTKNAKTLVMPKIGWGLDKLKWDAVKKLIEDVFRDINITIEVYYL